MKGGIGCGAMTAFGTSVLGAELEAEVSSN
jgi:hypothetical protein